MATFPNDFLKFSGYPVWHKPVSPGLATGRPYRDEFRRRFIGSLVPSEKKSVDAGGRGLFNWVLRLVFFLWSQVGGWGAETRFEVTVGPCVDVRRRDVEKGLACLGPRRNPGDPPRPRLSRVFSSAVLSTIGGMFLGLKGGLEESRRVEKCRCGEKEVPVVGGLTTIGWGSGAGFPNLLPDCGPRTGKFQV